jgi:hypothetical protein
MMTLPEKNVLRNIYETGYQYLITVAAGLKQRDAQILPVLQTPIMETPVHTIFGTACKAIVYGLLSVDIWDSLVSIHLSLTVSSRQ